MYLGIDLGTSNSAVAGSAGASLRLFKTSDGADVLPSVIYVDKRGYRLYGKRAYEQTMMSPDNVAKGFKRLMGTSTGFTFRASGQTMTPEECSAEILRQLVGQAVSESGVSEIEGAAVTIPAAFNQMQSEATLRAANAAGLDRVVLLQEPIAAAMAAMTQTKNKSGQFVVYDLGGGTFDLALVQSLSGSINIIGHEGINMLGGQDFDRRIVREVVWPWLAATFSLPEDFHTLDKYRRLSAKAQIKAEEAKIRLSTNERDTIFASDEDVQVKDEDGNDIYIDVPITRQVLEGLVEESLSQTIELTRKIIKDNGYTSQDIDRIVFVGGPSKMPWIRERVPQDLGIPCDLNADPMTAVAIGAAIYAESREWSGGGTSRKATRGSSRASGDLQITYEYPTRTADDRARLRIKAAATEVAKKYVIQIDSALGWTSGRIPLTEALVVEVPLSELGENAFRVVVFDSAGRPIDQGASVLTLSRTHATATAIPATQTISVKVRAGATRQKNVLDPLISKGTPLPASGHKQLQAAYSIGENLPGHIDLELYQDEGASEPELNLAVGVFRVKHDDLPDGMTIREGDPVIFHWTMDDSGLLSASVELPSVQQTFSAKRFYVDQAGHRTFEGDEGQRLAERLLTEARKDLDQTSEIIGDAAQSETTRIAADLEEQHNTLGQATTSDERRSVAEQARHLRQAAANLRDKPEHRAGVLSRRLEDLVGEFGTHVREAADASQTDLFDQRAVAAANEIKRQTPTSLDRAEEIIDEMQAAYFRLLWEQPAYVIWLFKSTTTERYLATDKSAFDVLVTTGEAALARNDISELRRVIWQMWQTQVSTGDLTRKIGQLASVLRG